VHGRAAPPADVIEAQLEVIFEERVPGWSVGLGRPTHDELVRSHAHGMKVVAMAATLLDARELEVAGVDAVVAQGSEAGGHRSTWTKRHSPQFAAIGAMAFVPNVAEDLDVPVIAAGGIVDGRGLVAALALGAQGVLMGTRFIPTLESAAPAFYRQRVLDADADDTMITDAFSGLYARTLRNTFAEQYASLEPPVFPALVQQSAARDIFAAAAAKGDASYFPLLAGQGCGRIRDEPGAGDIVERTVREARVVLAWLTGRGPRPDD
jgi:nitronate monooxygenase